MKRFYFAGLISLVILWGVLSVSAVSTKDLAIEVEALRQQVQQALDREEDSRAKIAALESRVNDLLTAQRQSQADQGVDPMELKQEINKVKAQMSDNKRQLEAINQTLQTVVLDSNTEINAIKERLQKLEKHDGLKIGPGPSQKTVNPDLPQIPDVETQPGQSPPPSGSGDYKKIYQKAVDLYSQGKKDEAKKQFEAFLNIYPNTEISDNALFMIGEYYYEKGEYEKAIVRYDDLRKKYPNGNKVPASLWKMALSFDKLKDRKTAVALLKELTAKYPKSPEAGLAAKQLEKWK